MKLRIVRINGNLMAGRATDDEAERGVLNKPMMIFGGSTEGSIILVPLIGNPSQVEITGTADYMYPVEDEGFIAHYNEVTVDIPGLQIVK